MTARAAQSDSAQPAAKAKDNDAAKTANTDTTAKTADARKQPRIPRFRHRRDGDPLQSHCIGDAKAEGRTPRSATGSRRR